MRKLFEIDKDIENFEWDIDPETGEILNPDALDDLQMERDAKIEGVGLKIKNLTAELDAVKREKANFDSRAKSLEREIEGYKNFLTYALDGQKFSTPRVVVGFRKSESVNITDEYLVPDEYCNFTVVRKPDKTRIKDALKKDKTIMGAELVEKQSAQIK